MAVIAKVDDAKLLKKMKRYEEVCKKEVSQQIRNHGRLLGLELMRQAQPYYEKGGIKERYARMKKIISGDINSVVIALNDYWQARFNEARSKSIKWRLYNKKRESWLTDEYRLINTLSELKAYYKAQKNPNRGRPGPRGDKTIGRWKGVGFPVVPFELMVKLREQLQSRIFWSKAGWAKAAQECKADTKAAAKLSGIPLEIKRHVANARGAVQDMTNGWWNTSGNPKVVLRSGVPWQSKILSDNQRRDAVNLTRGKFIRFLSAAIRAELKKQSQAS
jgi:hypothetical protein